MKSKAYGWAAIAVLLVLANISAAAQGPMQDRFERSGGTITFEGQINAYSPQTATTGTAGPYEIRGPWSLSLKRDRDGDTFRFSAAVNMELSDGWVLTTNRNSASPFDPSARNAHTHHITMTEGQITRLPNGGFEIAGTGTVTLNGGATPFAQQSSLTITITGGTDVEFSNMTMTFGLPASNHFGLDPLPGVVRSVKEER
ncbi:MAG TPA: hypothetical protein VHX60_14710 [Acidobacteriaceae bacterium]|nr:hypothetical protein [Acidobacteriaceae bacterium]